MIRETFQHILDKKDVRQNLILLKEELREDNKKDTHNKESLLYYLAGNYDIFYELLEDEDAKIRKNTAIIMGELAQPCFLPALFTAYQEETQRFVKSDYLKAMEEFDYREFLPELEKRIEELNNETVTDENKKHITEELKQLTKLVVTVKGSKKHNFTGYNVMSELVLLTNRNHIHVTIDQLKNIPRKEFSAGVMIKTNEIERILEIRTYQELLFALEEVKTVPMDANKAAKKLVDGKFLDFLKKRHDGDAPFYFRIELKSKSIENKGSFVKKLSTEIELLSSRSLINSTSNYEVELRLIENKDGNFNVLVKLYTLKDERFAYRKEVIATSIHPVNAALTIELARPYLKEEAWVLDPFCGVGTMLLERDKAIPTYSMYGLDIFSEGIDKARLNSKAASRIINYINRDFFDFKHEYLFDEIITNMPSIRGRQEEEALFTLYKKFFMKAKEHLKQDGIIVLYTHNRDFVRRLGSKDGFRIEKEFEISMREGTYVFVIRYM